MHPWGNDEALQLANQIRGPVKQGTLWRVDQEHADKLRLGIRYGLKTLGYESSSSRSSRRRFRMRLLSALMMAAAKSRLVFCNSRTFSSTVSRAMIL
jgi:hypothetical protein